MPPNPTPTDRQPPPAEADRQAARALLFGCDFDTEQEWEGAAETVAAALAQARREGAEAQREADCAALCEGCRAGVPTEEDERYPRTWWHGENYCGGSVLRRAGALREAARGEVTDVRP